MPASRQPRGFRCTELALSHDRLTDTLTRSGPSELQSHINAEETPAHTQLYPKLLWDQFKNTKDGSCRYSLCRILFLSKIIQTLMLILDNYATPPQNTNKQTKKHKHQTPKHKHLAPVHNSNGLHTPSFPCFLLC